MNTEIPRPEYPRPQFVRPDWLCLNGEWQFEIDRGDSGLERGLLERDLKQTIIVPFCPESVLSGIHDTDFLNAVWYRRMVTIPAEWAGCQVLLRFQACDYDTTVWIKTSSGSCIEVRRHRGGFTPFNCNLEGVAAPGDTITIIVRARDSHLPPQPRGKQSQRYHNHGCFYTRTTGIWQTVWLEPVPHCHLRRPRLTPDVAEGTIRLEQPISANHPGLQLRATLRDKQGIVSTACLPADRTLTPQLDLKIPQGRRHLWSPRDPHLYDIEIELLNANGSVLDRATSYAGLRGITIDGKAIKINGEVIFQRLVLDQGYYPDGIMTAPNDEALKHDIELALDAGFNGARLHQKVFEERFLYHADRLGYLCWGEFPDWGCRAIGPESSYLNHGITFAAQWLEALKRDYSHPCIIAWCPLNETYQEITDQIVELDDAARAMYLATKAMDTTRPVLDASGYSHRVPETDIYDCHDYEQDPTKFRDNHAGLAEGKPFINSGRDRPWSLTYRGQPFFVSEFGGIWWESNRTEEDSWGYGERPRTIEEFYARFEGLCDVLLDNPHMFGYCYTQLTDVYQEQNGIYTFDRRPKFDIERIRRIQQRPAAIENRL
ncbi:MAG: beta-galactosidase [Armatimonadota bacterium]|nr:beta-galactosidase [Armatimonadota bacterium]